MHFNLRKEARALFSAAAALLVRARCLRSVQGVLGSLLGVRAIGLTVHVESQCFWVLQVLGRGLQVQLVASLAGELARGSCLLGWRLVGDRVTNCFFGFVFLVDDTWETAWLLLFLNFSFVVLVFEIC